MIHPTIEWILQIKPIFPGSITHTINIMCLTIKNLLSSVHVTSGTLVLIRLRKTADLLERKINSTKDIKVLADEKGLNLAKNVGHIPSILGDRLIVVVRQAGNIFAVYINFIICQFLFLSMLKLFEWIYSVHSFIPIRRCMASI